MPGREQRLHVFRRVGHRQRHPVARHEPVDLAQTRGHPRRPAGKLANRSRTGSSPTATAGRSDQAAAGFARSWARFMAISVPHRAARRQALASADARARESRRTSGSEAMTDSAELSSIEAYEALREAVGEPTASIAEKEMPMLDKHARHFLSLSPILFISTVGTDGRADISPRGDPAGFVKVIDDNTILIPERPGNRRADTMSNIIENPGHSVALIFLLPGVEETLRASGRARVIDDPDGAGRHGGSGQGSPTRHPGRDRRGVLPLRQGAQARAIVGSRHQDRSQASSRRSPRSPGISANRIRRWKRSRNGSGRATRPGSIE